MHFIYHQKLENVFSRLVNNKNMSTLLKILYIFYKNNLKLLDIKM